MDHKKQHGAIKGERFEKSPIVIAQESPFFDVKTIELDLVYIPKQKRKTEEQNSYFYPET